MRSLTGICLTKCPRPGGVPFGTYNIVQRFNYPLQVQAQVFMALCLVNWCQILLYHNKWALWKVILIGLANAAVFAGVEAALILTLQVLMKPEHNAIVNTC